MFVEPFIIFHSQHSMKINALLTLLALAVLQVFPALIYIPQIPVDPLTLYQLQVSCNILEADLNYNPNLPNRYADYYYGDVYLANYFLQKVANDPGIASYNNVLYGEGNVVTGDKNLIFGDGNSVLGSQNYIFSSNFSSQQVSSTAISNNLVLDNWLIDLYRMYLIPFNPRLALSRWM